MSGTGLRVVGGGERALLHYNGRPRILRTATEHYGALINRPFDYSEYLPMLTRSGSNLTRTFVLFRELQSAVNPYSTCKPESINYIAPYSRTGAGTALDGQPRYDLDAWNEEFFLRLHDFLGLAARYDVTVELTLLSNVYGDAVWSLSPLHPKNNVNELPACDWPEFLTMRHEDVVARQDALIAKVVGECRAYDNVIFEVCNEPGAGAPGTVAEPTKPDEVNAWLAHLIRTIRTADAAGGATHLIAGQEAFHYEPWEQPLDRSFSDLDFDIVNVHPLPNTTLQGRAYELGRFMSGDLRLAEVKAFCQAAATAGKPVNLDEDNTATQYTNDYGWRIHRKRAWTTVLAGCHYDMIDFTIWPGVEHGTAAAQHNMREWTWTLSRILDRFEVATAQAWAGCLPQSDPTALTVSAIETSGSYLIYLADARESAPPDKPAVTDGATVDLTLPAGTYAVRRIDPATGAETGIGTVTAAGDRTALNLPSFLDDILLIITPA